MSGASATVLVKERANLGVLLAVVAMLAAVVLGFNVFQYGREHFAVKDCFELGGNFDFDTSTCDMVHTHAWAPYHERHPFALWTSGMAALVCMGFSLAWFVLRRRPARRPAVTRGLRR